jgi:hypothetical protein
VVLTGSTAEMSCRRGEEVGEGSVKVDKKETKKKKKTIELKYYNRETFAYENKLPAQVGSADCVYVLCSRNP